MEHDSTSSSSASTVSDGSDSNVASNAADVPLETYHYGIHRQSLLNLVHV